MMSQKSHVFNLFIGVLAATGAMLGTCQTLRAEETLTADDMPREWLFPTDSADVPALQADWWRSFGDPLLDSLINVGVENNYDALMAARRVEIARQTLNQARSQLFPVFGMSAGWSGNRTSGATTSPAHDAVKTSAWSLGVDMSWQIDLFGRIGQQVKGSKARWRASRIDMEGVRITVEAKIASTYLAIRTLQMQRDVAQEHIASQKHILDIAKARHEAGLNSKLDVAQASTVYFSTMASLPSIENAIATDINALAVLSGIDGADLRARLADGGNLPAWRPLLDAGVPADLLRRRPDIVAARTLLEADAAAIGVARKDFLPALSLTGSIGTAAHSVGDLFTRRSFEYSVSPTLSWTIFDGMGRKAALAEAREQMQYDIDNYNLTIATAVEEVNNALGDYDTALRQIDLYSDVAAQAREALTLSLDLYKGGLNPFNDVASAQIDYLNYANMLVQAKGAALSALVAVYQALGGGWE